MKIKKYISVIQFLKLEGGYHLFIRISVNGKPARVLIDTGASHTVFDQTEILKMISSEKFIAHDKLSAGIGTNSLTSQLAVIDSLTIGTLKIYNFKSVIIDLHHVNFAYKQMKHKPILGVIGSDILKKYNAVIDYGNKKLIFQIKGSGAIYRE